ncbi:DUF4321 domain-containing protein [Clostridium oryzae]|uniref:DUF4321 domain-containing protein n=1 Tax=Clostridium oryzae TaxID=1450648 RepID=A0A1V4IUL7_9CLOT|nr:DUF4321 domain-containing protein [Clostridium oryzae]OPJ63748.1 hypothetical protein CLORY_09320 [Clostridium oryzae]
MRNSNSSALFFAFVIFLGAISGSIVGDILGNMTKLNFIKHVYHIGTGSPMTIDLKVMTFTLGFNFGINIMSIIGMILAIIILYRKH